MSSEYLCEICFFLFLNPQYHHHHHSPVFTENGAMNLRKRKTDDNPLLQFSELFSPFPKAITAELLGHCGTDLPIRTSDGAGRNTSLCFHNTISDLSPDEKVALDANIRSVFVDKETKLPTGLCHVKHNDTSIFSTNSKTTFADIHRASSDNPLIVCCCDKFKKLLKMPSIIPEGETSTDVLSFGATYSAMHTDMGGSYRDQIIVNQHSYKIHIIARSRDLTFQSMMTEKIESWTTIKDDTVTVDCKAEISWILANPYHFTFFLQHPFQQIQHCGANYHCVLTLVSDKQGITLSVGYRSAHEEATRNYMMSDPDKSFQRGGVLVPAKTAAEKKVWSSSFCIFPFPSLSTHLLSIPRIKNYLTLSLPHFPLLSLCCEGLG